MSHIEVPDAYGTLTEAATLRIQRLLPGPIERVWSYITDSELRAQWLAQGRMEMKAGSAFELVWRNDELTDPPGTRPAGFGAEHRMDSRITACDPQHKLAFTWGQAGGSVSIELQSRGDKVLLTLIHHRLPDRATTLMVGAGWHMHLDLLVARVAGSKTEPFWDGWSRLHQDYDQRVPA